MRVVTLVPKTFSQPLESPVILRGPREWTLGSGIETKVPQTYDARKLWAKGGSMPLTVTTLPPRRGGAGRGVSEETERIVRELVDLLDSKKAPTQHEAVIVDETPREKESQARSRAQVVARWYYQTTGNRLASHALPTNDGTDYWLAAVSTNARKHKSRNNNN